MSGAASFGLLLMRGILGVVFIAHGGGKLFGWFGGKGMDPVIGMVGNLGLPGNIPPHYLAYAAAISEFGGGILLILGLLTRLAAIALVITMAVAVWKVHIGGFFLNSNPPAGGMEYALTLGIVALGLVFTGAGLISIDAAMPWGRKARRRTKKD